MPTSNIAITDGGVVLEGGKVKGTVNIHSEISSYDQVRNSVGINIFGSFFVLDPSLGLISPMFNVDEVHYTDYTKAGAALSKDWVYFFEFQKPTTPGVYYISYNIKVENTWLEWPTSKVFETQWEFFYTPIEVPDLAQSGWKNNGKFEVAIGDFIAQGDYNWTPGLTLNERVDLTATIDGHEIQVIIDAGTLVLGTSKLQIDYVGAEVVVLYPDNALFSPPVEVLVDGVTALLINNI